MLLSSFVARGMIGFNRRMPRVGPAVAACLAMALLASAGGRLAAEEFPRLVLTVGERVVSLEQTTVPPETVAEYPLPAQLLWEYQRAPNPRKSYVRYWITPGGMNILRDAPADHLHHHGLMFAVGVDDVDFWAEDPASGWQLDQGDARSGTHVFTEATGRRYRLAWFEHKVAWAEAEGTRLLLEEKRRVAWVDLHPVEGVPVRMVVWESELTLPPGKDAAKLWGRPYFGLGIRFIEPMDKTGEFFNAEGATGVEATNGSRSRWCAYRVVANDRPVTVVMLDHPENPRHPATWFTMVAPFAYMSATLRLHEEPLVLKGGEKLRLRYGVALWDGLVPPEVIERLYQAEVASSSGIFSAYTK